jgi:hypothetical protein
VANLLPQHDFELAWFNNQSHLVAKQENYGWETAVGKFGRQSISLMICRVILHAVNLRHGTDGFTSPPSSSAGFEPATGSPEGPVASTLTTWPPRAALRTVTICNYFPVPSQQVVRDPSAKSSRIESVLYPKVVNFGANLAVKLHYKLELKITFEDPSCLTKTKDNSFFVVSPENKRNKVQNWYFCVYMLRWYSAWRQSNELFC